MQITRETEYATRAVLQLARNGKNEPVPTSKVAKEQNIPPTFLAKIVSQLSIAGLLDTSRGARGGVKLARNPGDISLLAVIEAINGPIRLNICVENKGICALEGDCPLQLVWSEVQAELVAKLKNTNFGQLAKLGESQI